jgi:hypothetical protein
MRRPASIARIAPLCVLAVVSTGCVERTIRITSEPSGALVWLNDREIGRTPVDVGFVHYGTYDVRLIRDGYEPLHTAGEAKPPPWDIIGIDLAAELLPADLHSDVHWHFELEPALNDREGLLERAEAMREELRPHLADDQAAEPTPADGG